MAKILKICYAMPIEATKSTVRKGLQMKEQNLPFLFEVLAKHPKTIARILSAPWVRFSAFGAFPNPTELSDQDKSNFAKVACYLRGKIDAGLVHFPTETLGKYSYLKSIGFRPRLSFQTNIKGAISFNGLSSVMVKEKKRFTANLTDRRPIVSIETMRKINKAGKVAKVCPSIVNKKVKCGVCTLCGNDAVDVIIYPMH
jgi:hypothetical protein